MRFLLFPLILYPLLELWVLIKVGGAIGVLPTLGLILASAVVGFAILRRVGWQTMSRVNQRLYRGEAPNRELLVGASTALGGLLLLLPGFIGDAIGLLFLLPAGGRWLRGPRGDNLHTGPSARHNPSEEGPVTLEGEYRRED